MVTSTVPSSVLVHGDSALADQTRAAVDAVRILHAVSPDEQAGTDPLLRR